MIKFISNVLIRFLFGLKINNGFDEKASLNLLGVGRWLM